MNELRNNLKNKYSQIPNELITDLRLSNGSLRVVLYLFTKPDNWEVFNYNICKNLNISEKTLSKYWKEILASGWMKRERKKDENGKLHGGYIYRIGTFFRNGTLSVSEHSSVSELSSDTTKVPIISNTNLKSNNKLKENNNNPIEKSKPNKIDRFAIFVDKVKVVEKAENFDKVEVERFIDYWTESNDGECKMRFEKEKTWSLGMRLKRWFSNNYKYSKNPKTTNNQQADRPAF